MFILFYKRSVLRNKIFSIIIVSLIVISTSFGQNKIFEFNFDDCSYEDAALSFPGITPVGNPNCVCGINTQSFDLNGTSDLLVISEQANIHFEKDFTLDLYFWMDGNSGEINIFSHRNGCTSLDSLMSLSYYSGSNEILFEIASSVNNYHSTRAKLDMANCWHRFVLVKFGLEYLVYLDNVLIGKILSKENIIFSKQTSLILGTNPCISASSRKFEGRFDEVSLYGRALSELELRGNFKFPDRIITDNTTIFKGESITLELGNTCASDILWTPGSSLNDDQTISPLATPDVSTTYEVVLNNGTCISKDSVRIFVADKDELDCNSLLLPSAFTPNNDGLNDRFGISNLFIVESMSYFEIYDRWGAKVWETREPTEKWDGSFNGNPLNSGMYLYKIKYSCGAKERLVLDNFTLMR